MGITRIAMLAIVVVAHAVPAVADQRRVPMLVVDAPPTFEPERFATALETYVMNAQVVLAPRDVGPDDAVCADAMERARAVASPVGLWARWADGTMVVSMVTVETGCATTESSTVEVPPEQPAFVYRVAALKIGSLLQVLPAVAVVEPPKPEIHVIPPPPPPPIADDPSVLRLELGATGVASPDAAARTYALVAAGWFGARVAFGGTLLASAAHDAETAGGSGSARMFGALAGVRATLLERSSFAIDGELDVGVLSVWSSAERIDGSDGMSEQVWTPVASLAPRVRFGLAGPLSVAVGPTLDITSRSVDLMLGETPLYHAGLVRFRWDVRAQIWF